MTDRDWHALARAVQPRSDAFVDGSFVPAADGDRFPSVNPATGEVLAKVAACGAGDVDRAVAAARRAFADGRWAGRSPGERKAVLLRLAELVREHADELALLDSLDAGKLIADTSTVDVPGSAAILQWYAEAVDKVYGEIAPTGAGDLALVSREPLGVVGAVVPWNYPLETAVWKLAPALAAGNSVVLKPAEESPLSVLRLAELAAEAGLPDGVLNVVPGTGPVAGQALGRHPDVDAIAFTGSTAVGKLVQVYAGESNMKQVWLECGGKSANVVLPDAADLDAVADGVVFGIFGNSGQVCSANSRLVVHRSVADELLARVLERTADLRPGDPLDPATRMAPLVAAATAAVVSSAAPVPRLLAKPSEMGANQRAPCRAGHRRATVSSTAVSGRSGSCTADSWSAPMPAAASIRSSHCPVRRSSRPVHAAVAVPAAVVPSSRR